MRTRYFYLKDKHGIINKVDLIDVGRLASFSMNLEPIKGTLNVGGYYLALREHMNKNKDNLLFDCYNLIISDMSGIELLYSNINFCFYEKLFREKVPTERDIAAYNIVVNDYHRILSENIKKFKNNYNTDKSKSK